MKELWETNEGIKLSRGVFQRGGGEFWQGGVLASKF